MCYFVSNARLANQAEAEELFDAISRHWLLEVTHHYRNVTFAEEGMKTKSQSVSGLRRSLLTIAVNLLERLKPKNMAAQISKFADDCSALVQFMTP